MGRAHEAERAVGADDDRVRQQIGDDTDRLTPMPWELLGEAESIRFHEELEPSFELLRRHVDETAGPNYQPGSRIRT